MTTTKNVKLRYIDSLLRQQTKHYDKATLKEKLEEKFDEEICDRTLEHYFKTLREDFCVDIPMGKGPKNYTSDTVAFPEVDLSNEDYIALEFAYNLLSEYKSISLFENFRKSLAKISREHQQASVNESNPFIFFEAKNMLRGWEHITKLYPCIVYNKKVYMTYQAGYKKQDKRIIEPLLLKESSRMWYLVAISPKEPEKIKTYAVDRIIEIEQLDDDFTFSDEQRNQLAERMEKCYGISIPEELETTTTIKFRCEKTLGKFLISRPLHPTQKTIKDNEQEPFVELEIHVLFDPGNTYASRELVRDFIKYTGDLEVLEPESLKALIDQQLNKNLSKMNKKELTVVGACIRQNGKIMLARRARKDHLGSKWEFPGGKLEPGENHAQALVREIREEFDVAATAGETIGENTVDYGDRIVHLRVLEATIEGEPQLIVHDELIWVQPDELAQIDLAEADKFVVGRVW